MLGRERGILVGKALTGEVEMGAEKSKSPPAY
jgi:hypothetical protein